MISVLNDYIKLDTKNTSLIFKIEDGDFKKVFYGKKLKNNANFDIFKINMRDSWNMSVDDTKTDCYVFSCTGDGNNRESTVILTDEKGVFVNRFTYAYYEIKKGELKLDKPCSHGKKETLIVYYKDKLNKLTLKQYISVLNGSDAIIFRNEIINEGKKNYSVKRLMSLTMDFYNSSAIVKTFDGAWGRERKQNVHAVNSGVFYVDSKIGSSSNTHNPFMIVKPDKQGVIGLNLIYSGNHKEIVEVMPMGRIRLLNGINDYAFSYTLSGGDALSSPESVIVYGETEQDVTTKMHNFVKANILNSKFKDANRPILINNWEATYFDFDSEKLNNIAKQAADIGLEMFVLDDGWFGKRNTDNCSLGDWFDNEKKTGGLNNLSKSLKNLGLKFGLWVEPEMISVDSDLFRAHPEYMMQIPGQKPIEKRWQQMLDFCNKEVQDYVINVLTDLFNKVKPSYIKWDCNRVMYDIYSPKLVNNGEYFHKYIRGVYRVIECLTESFPDILFESCSAGGNRYDLGMLCFMPQTWASDNTDARDRLYIQEGTLYAYPQCTMSSHLSASPNHQTWTKTSIENRFNVAAAGVFGYELDLTKLSNEEIETIKKQIAFYKKHRQVLLYGDYFRLGSVNDGVDFGWIVVSPDKSKAIATLVIQKRQINESRLHFKLTGLNDNVNYKVSMRKQDNIETIKPVYAYGDALNSYGLDFGNFFDKEFDRTENSNSICTRMLLIEAVK